MLTRQVKEWFVKRWRPLGIVLTRLPKISNLVIGIASVLQTIPSLALLAFPFLLQRPDNYDQHFSSR
jgi:hypothetical protein